MRIKADDATSESNQINSWFSAPPTTRTTTHYIVRLVRSLELGSTVGSLKEECFQGALESWRGTHQLEFCWQPVPRLGCSDGERPLTEFQTGPGDDIIAVGRSPESRPRWDIGDCSQHTSQVGWRMAICALGGTICSRPVAWSAVPWASATGDRAGSYREVRQNELLRLSECWSLW